jgi:hypothetical protein
MLHTHKRIAAGIAALTLALGTAAPAAAMPNQLGLFSAGPNVQPTVQATSHGSGGSSSSGWGYIAAGGGVTSLALIGIGGTVAGRRQRRTGRSTVAA